MSPAGVRKLRVAAVVLPVFAFILILHFLAPGLRTRHRVGTLPEGYVSIESGGPYEFFARPENRTAREAGRMLTGFRRALFREYGREFSLVERDARFQVIIFSDHEDLRAFGEGHLGSDFARNAGFYIPDWQAMGIVGDGDPANLKRPLLHEGMHMILDVFVKGGGHEWSRWFDEGLATYFEASSVSPGGKVRLGGTNPQLLSVLREDIRSGRALSMDDLITAGDAEFEGERNLSYYATSALFIHLMLEGGGGRMRDRFFNYFEAERSPGPVAPGTLAREIEDPAALDLRLREYVLRLR